MSSDEMSKIQELFDNLRADKYPLEEYQSIGKRGVRRLDGYEKASGAAKYTIDVQLPGMLHTRFLTSPYPHAEIKSHVQYLPEGGFHRSDRGWLYG